MCIGGLACLVDAEPISEEQCNVHKCNDINALPSSSSHHHHYKPHHAMYNDNNNAAAATRNSSSNTSAEKAEENSAPRGEMFGGGDAPSNEIVIDEDDVRDSDTVNIEDNSVPVGKIEEVQESTTLSTDVITTVLPSTEVVTEEITTIDTAVTSSSMVPTLKIAKPSPNHKWIPLFWNPVSYEDSMSLPIFCTTLSSRVFMNKNFINTSYSWMMNRMIVFFFNVLLFCIQCSAPCNGGLRTRSVMCINTKTLEEDAEEQCQGHAKPDTERECNMHPCPLWKVGDWSEVREGGRYENGYKPGYERILELWK